MYDNNWEESEINKYLKKTKEIERQNSFDEERYFPTQYPVGIKKKTDKVILEIIIFIFKTIGVIGLIFVIIKMFLIGNVNM